MNRTMLLGLVVVAVAAVAGYVLLADGGDERPATEGSPASKTPAASKSGPSPLAAPQADHAVWRRVRWFDHPSGPVKAVRVSKDGRVVVTGGADGRVIVWNAANAKPLRLLTRQKDEAVRIAISPDGKWVATADKDDTVVRLWEVASGQRRLLSGHGKRVVGVAFSPDGRTLASGSADGTVRFWSVATGAARKVLTAGDGSKTVARVHFSPDGRWLASEGVYSNEVLIWDVSAGRQRFTLRHEKRIGQVTFSPAGNAVATASNDRTVVIWSLETGKALHRLEGHNGPVGNIAYSPDGRILASGSVGRSNPGRLWNAADGTLLRVLKDLDAPVLSLVFSKDGTTVVTANRSHLQWWEVATGTEIRKVAAKTSIELYRAGGEGLVSLSYAGRARLRQMADGAPLRTFDGHTHRISAASLSADGRFVATGGWDKVARVWEARTGKLLSATGAHPERIIRIALSPDGQLLATLAASSKTIDIWDSATGRKVRTISGPEERYNSIALGPKGRLLLASVDDETVRLYDVTTGEERKSFKSPSTHVSGPIVAMGPKGKLAAAGFLRGEIRLWDIETGTLLHSVKDTRVVTHLAFHPEARLLATATSAGYVRVYDVASGSVRHRLQPHKGDVWAVAFSPDGKTLVSGGRDATLQFLDVETGKPHDRVKTLDWVRAIQFAPDGRSILVADDKAGAFLLERRASRQP